MERLAEFKINSIRPKYEKIGIQNRNAKNKQDPGGGKIGIGITKIGNKQKKNRERTQGKNRNTTQQQQKNSKRTRENR